MLSIAVITALLIGFLVGLLSFKTKSRWCPQCGSWTQTGAEPDHHGVNRV